MKLKTNRFKILLILIVAITQQLNAQHRIKLNGLVKNDSIFLQDINILNRTSNFGVSSNKNGQFTIFAKEGDSIEFSSVVYTNRTIKVSKTHINSKKITVYLEQDYYQLNEIMLAKKIFINWRDAAVTDGTIFNNDKISNNKAPNAKKLTDPNAIAGGLNPIALFQMFTKKRRLKRKTKKLEEQKNKKLQLEFPITIKNLYGASFFTEWLQIPNDEINLFLDFCEGKGLSKLYDSNEIQIKDFLIKQAKTFNSIKK